MASLIILLKIRNHPAGRLTAGCYGWTPGSHILTQTPLELQILAHSLAATFSKAEAEADNSMPESNKELNATFNMLVIINILN